MEGVEGERNRLSQCRPVPIFKDPFYPAHSIYVTTHLNVNCRRGLNAQGANHAKGKENLVKGVVWLALLLNLLCRNLKCTTRTCQKHTHTHTPKPGSGM